MPCELPYLAFPFSTNGCLPREHGGNQIGQGSTSQARGLANLNSTILPQPCRRAFLGTKKHMVTRAGKAINSILPIHEFSLFADSFALFEDDRVLYVRQDEHQTWSQLQCYPRAWSLFLAQL